MATKWGVKRENLNFTSAYDYIDNYYSTWYEDPDLLAKPDLSPESKALVQEIIA